MNYDRRLLSEINTRLFIVVEYGIIGEGSQISMNQKRENSAFRL